jgi:membrane associated rhomboid family serine protease
MVFVFPIQDENKPSRRPYVTWGLVVVNVAVFIFLFVQPEAQYDYFYSYGVIPANILQGKDLWTLLTCMFMHADAWHIIGNMVFLWIFGDNIEDTLGHGWYLAFYLIGGLFAEFTHIASALISEYVNLVHELTVPSIGASGAISAVLGAYILLFPNARIRTFVYVIFIISFSSIPAYYYLGFWFLYQVLMGLGSLVGPSTNVAFWAHIGGFALGMAVVKVIGVKPTRRQPVVPGEQPPASVTAPLVISPLVDVLVDEDRVTVLANMPGLEPRDIRIEVSEREVVISAEYMDMKFYRQVSLSVPVKPKVENLLYRNGVLSFTLYRIQLLKED